MSKKTAWIFIVPVVLMLSLGQLRAEGYSIFGQGHVTCANWNTSLSIRSQQSVRLDDSRLQDFINAVGQMAWVLGYWSGASAFGSRAQADALGVARIEIIFALVDQQCEMDPARRLADAVYRAAQTRSVQNLSASGK